MSIKYRERPVSGDLDLLCQFGVLTILDGKEGGMLGMGGGACSIWMGRRAGCLAWEGEPSPPPIE